MAMSGEDELLAYVKRALWRLVRAQGRMLDNWAEGDKQVQKSLWRELHAAGQEVRDILENYQVCEKLKELGR